MSIIGMIIFGAIVGAIAKLIMPGKDPGGIIVTIILICVFLIAMIAALALM